MVLSHDSYFSPSSSADHELRSPFPGNPWNTSPAFGGPSDVITVELKGVRVGVSVRNSATSFSWVGPVFLPLIPIPGRDELETSRLCVWLAVLPESDVDVRLDRLRVHLSDGSPGLPPAGIYGPALVRIDGGSVTEPQHVAGRDGKSWYLAFDLPGLAKTSFDLQVDGIVTSEGPLPGTRIHFSNVRSWRIISLP
jgi:hypothetical protein